MAEWMVFQKSSWANAVRFVNAVFLQICESVYRYFSSLLLPRPNFFLLPSNLKWPNIFHETVKCLCLNIQQLFYVLLWIKHFCLWNFSSSELQSSKLFYLNLMCWSELWLKFWWDSRRFSDFSLGGGILQFGKGCYKRHTEINLHKERLVLQILWYAFGKHIAKEYLNIL